MSPWPNNGQVLEEFRNWLDEVRAEADAIADEQLPEDLLADSGFVGLSQLVEGFTAFRHELKLQTKSSRALAERTETTISTMQEAIEAFRTVEARESQAAQEAAKPLVESLIELDESLKRGRTVIDNARRSILEDLTGQLQDQLGDLLRRQPFWRRWICRRWHRAAGEILLQRTALLHRNIFDSLVEGYEVILKRLARAMEREGIYRIVCVGKPVDPGTMTVVEAVDDPLRPPGMVVEEIRPGYYWKDRLIRFAEVRAVQGRTG